MMPILVRPKRTMNVFLPYLILSIRYLHAEDEEYVEEHDGYK